MLGIKVENKLEMVIGPESEIKGDISVRGAMRLDGKVVGNVSVAGTLYCGRSSFVKGEVHCKNGILAGKIEGNVTATGALELQSGSAVTGDVRCHSLTMDKAAFLDGRVKMDEGS